MPITTVAEPRPIKLSETSTNPPNGTVKDAIKVEGDAFEEELTELDDLLYFAHQHGVLIVLQGLDTSGKDGMIRKVLDCCNAQGVRVEGFKSPTEHERAHDFLWRIHAKAPAKGEIVLFNRSQYEDVLITRVHDLVPADVIEQRYALINDFERLLVATGTIVFKFFLHITKEEQKRRLLEREELVHKAWKLAVGDWKERQHWDSYTAAYELALERCATKDAPWHIVPADAKWYRNHLVVKALVEGLRPYKAQWMESLAALGKKRTEELKAFRQTTGA
jgi:PPK2 family polyphosphate:nucleotide phosphotransferase